MTLNDLVGCQAELEWQMFDHKDVQQMLMSENEALRQQVVQLRHDLVPETNSTLIFYLLSVK